MELSTLPISTKWNIPGEVADVIRQLIHWILPLQYINILCILFSKEREPIGHMCIWREREREERDGEGEGGEREEEKEFLMNWPMWLQVCRLETQGIVDVAADCLKAV